eukprot:Gb_14148 [translate_table: standard]
MVITKVPVEVVLVAPIWGHYGIQSQVNAVITPCVVVGPIIAHIHILVVVEALSGLIVSNDSSVFSVDVSSSVVQWSGKVTVDSSRGLLGSVLSSSFVNFGMGFDEKPRGLLQLVLLVQEFANSCITFDAVILSHDRLGDAPNGLASVYEKNFCLRFPGSRRFKGMRPFVSHSRDLGPLSLRLPCAWHEYFCVGSMVLGSILSAWSHSFCQRANLSALVYGFYDNSYPLGGIRTPPGCGWFSYKSPSLPQPGSSRYEPSHPFAL